MKKYSKFLAVLLAVAMILPGLAQAGFAAEGLKVTRLSGGNAVETAIDVSQEAYDKADTVVIAGRVGSADALTGTLLAASKNAPLLIAGAGKDENTAKVVAEIKRLGAKEVIILGGEEAVKPVVKAELEAIAGVTVTRIDGGKDGRWGTAAELAKKADNTKNVFLALGRTARAGDSLADALVIGPVAAKLGRPVLLTKTNELPEATKKAIKDLGVTNVTIVGGEGAVTPAVKAELEAMGLTVDRDAGGNRYDTATVVARKYFANPENLILASGLKDADALVGGYFGVKLNAPILLTREGKLADETKAYMEANKLNTYVLGGTTVVEEAVVTEAEAVLAGEEVEELKVVSVSAINTNGTKVALEGQTVSPGVKFEVVYSEEIKASTANLNSIKLYKGTALAPVIKIEVAGDNKTVTVTPAAMSNSSDYKLSLSKAVQTATGTAATAKDVTFKTNNNTFVTGLTTDVTGSNTSITTNVVPLGDLAALNIVELQFNNKLDSGSINASTVKIYNTTEDKEVAGTITPAISGTSSIRFNIPATAGDWKVQAANSTYRIEVSGVIDEFGNTIEDYTKNVVVAPTAPSVTVRKSDGSIFANNDVLNYRKATITNDSDVVVPGAKITLTFNVKMDLASVNSNNIYVETATGEKVAGDLSYDANSKIATWVPKTDLEQDASFKFVINNKVKDQFGQIYAGLTRKFTTTSAAPSQVVSVTPENGTQTAVPVNEVFTVNFKFANKTYEDTLTPSAQQTPAGATNKNDKTASVHVYNAATGAYVNPANYTISQETNLENIKVTFKTGILNKNATYAIKLIGKNDSGDSVKTTIVDGFGNPMSNDYLYTFTTEPADTATPAPTKVVTVTAGGDAFGSAAKELTNGAVNVDDTKDLDIIFSKQLGVVTFDSLADANIDGNVVLEELNVATGVWSQSALSNSSRQNDAVKGQGYVRIGAADLSANKKYRVTIIPTVGASTIKDLAGVNAMEEEFTFTFSTGNGPVSVDPSTTLANTNSDVTTASAAVGSNKVNAVNLTGAANDNIAIELSTGDFFFTTFVSKDAGNDITLGDPLPKTVATGAKIVNLTTVNSSFAKYSTSVDTKAPLAIRVNGNAGAKLDEATIENAVKLYKDADNSVVPAKITYKLINSDQDALVSINPTDDLDGSTAYYIRVDGLKDKLGNEQTSTSKATKLSFKTVAVTEQVVLSEFNITPGQLVSPKKELSFKVANTDLTKAQIEALFADDVQDDTIAVVTSTIDIVEIDGVVATGDKVKATISYVDGTVTVTPTIPLQANTTYQLRIAKDAFGGGAAQLSEDKTIEFRTTAAVAPKLLSAKHIEAGATGLEGDVFILTLDSSITVATNAPAADGSDFNTFFTITGGQLSNQAAANGIQSVKTTNNGKTVTITYGGVATGDYIIPTQTTIAPTVTLKAVDTDNTGATGIAFSTDSVVITK